MSKRIWIGLAAALVAFAAALALLVDAEQFRPALKAQLEKALARPVDFGAFSLSFIPLALRAESLQVGEDSRFGSKPFILAKSIRVRVQFWPLLSKRVEIQSVQIVEPSVELIRREGIWNYESVGGPKSASNPSTAVRLDKLEIEGGQIAVTLDDAARVVYPKTNLLVTGLGTNEAGVKLTAVGTVEEVSGTLTGEAEVKAGAVKGSLALREGRLKQAAFGDVDAKFDLTPGASSTEIRSLEVRLGKLAVRAKGSVRDRQLALRLDAPRAPIGELVRLAAAFGQGLPTGLNVEGQLEAGLEVQGTISQPQVTGTVEAHELKFAGGEIKQPVRSGAVKIELLPGVIRSSPFEIMCGPTKLSGYFSVKDYATRPLLESALITENSELANLMQIAQAYGVAAAGMRASGKATLRLRVHGPLAKGATLQFAGKGSLDGATIELPSLTQPVHVERAQLAFAQDSATIEGLSLKAAGSTVTGRLEANNFAAPRVQFALAADQVNTEELTKLFKPAKAGAASKPARYSADGTLSVGSLKFNKVTLASVRATANVHDGVLRLDPLTASLYGGASTGKVTIDTRGANSTIALESRLDRIESSQLLTAIGNLPQLISGPFGADIKLTLAPKPDEEPLKSMSGNVALRFSGGRLHTMNLMGELHGIAQFLYGPKAEEKFTSFLSMQGDLALDKGVGQTRSLKFDLNDATATFAGGMNFVDQTLNMKLVSVLNRKLAEAVGGNKIGGWMTAAVQNSSGELIIPTVVTGTFARPRLAPDAPAMAKLKLQNTVPALAQDPRAIIDAVKGGKEGLKNVLDIFGGGARKKQKQ